MFCYSWNNFLSSGEKSTFLFSNKVTFSRKAINLLVNVKKLIIYLYYKNHLKKNSALIISRNTDWSKFLFLQKAGNICERTNRIRDNWITLRSVREVGSRINRFFPGSFHEKIERSEVLSVRWASNVITGSRTFCLSSGSGRFDALVVHKCIRIPFRPTLCCRILRVSPWKFALLPVGILVRTLWPGLALLTPTNFANAWILSVG